MKLARRTLAICAFLMFISIPAYSSDKEIVEISVIRGDYLINICDLYVKESVKWREIAELNHLKNPSLIYPGEKLKIPVDYLRGAPTNGTVTFVKGEVHLFEKGPQDWKKVQENDVIDAGTSIKTGDESAVEISYENGITIFLRSNTQLKLLLTRKIDSFHVLFKYLLGIGKSIVNIKEAIGYGSRFTIETPSAVAGARGTSFRLSNDLSELTRCEVLEGTVLIQGRKSEIDVFAGEGVLIAKGERPQSPVKLLSPPDPINLLNLYRSMPLELRFSEVDQAAMYAIMLAKDVQFKNIVKNYSIEPSGIVSIIDLTDGLYYLKTSSRDTLGLEGPWSEPHVLNVRVNPLPPFTQFPSDGAVIRAKGIQLKWLKVTDAAKYYAQVSDDSAFGVLRVDDRDLNGLTLELKDLAPKEYFFRIKSIASDGYEGIWSDVVSFRVAPPPPAPPLEKPGVGKEDISIRWRDLGKGVRYHFQMSKDGTFEHILVDQVIDKPQVTITKPEESGVYYVRTSGIDSTGYEGDFSEPQSFEIKKPFPFTNLGIFLGTTLLMIIIL